MHFIQIIKNVLHLPFSCYLLKYNIPKFFTRADLTQHFEDPSWVVRRSEFYSRIKELLKLAAYKFEWQLLGSEYDHLSNLWLKVFTLEWEKPFWFQALELFWGPPFASQHLLRGCERRRREICPSNNNTTSLEKNSRHLVFPPNGCSSVSHGCFMLSDFLLHTILC